MYVILVYDIKLDQKGPKILNHTFKICKKYLTHIKNSVFEGEISEGNLMKMQNELKAYTRDDVDSVIVFKSRNQRWLDKEFWAKQDDKTSNFL